MKLQVVDIVCLVILFVAGLLGCWDWWCSCDGKENISKRSPSRILALEKRQTWRDLGADHGFEVGAAWRADKKTSFSVASGISSQVAASCAPKPSISMPWMVGWWDLNLRFWEIYGEQKNISYPKVCDGTISRIAQKHHASPKDQ